MTKRPCDSEEYTRQMKKVVTDAMVNENDPTLMNTIYGKLGLLNKAVSLVLFFISFFKSLVLLL